MNIYVGIGNSDDKLSQADWASYVEDVAHLIIDSATEVHGAWFSLPHSAYQNACWCFSVIEDDTEPGNREIYRLRRELRRLAGQYRQDSIAWAVAEPEFLRPMTRSRELAEGTREEGEER